MIEFETALSCNQQFLCLFGESDESGPFGPGYHMIGTWRLTGPVEIGVLRGALADVVARHEPLRTQIDRGTRRQRVFPPCEPDLDVRDRPGLTDEERGRAVGALVEEAESGTFGIDRLPHLRAVLVRFGDDDSVLLLQTHHTATDGWSLRLIARDLAACYVARRDGGDPDLPPVRPYRDFVAWERAEAASETTARAVRYWTETLGRAGITALRADHPRSERRPAVTAAYRFSIEADIIRHVEPVAKRERCTPFMVMLAAYYRLVHRLTGQSDVVVTTHTPGRGNGRFNDTVGSFFNFLPLRVDLAACGDAGELMRRTRSACLGAYRHDIPAMRLFEALPTLMAPAMADEYAPVTFQVFPRALALDGEDLGDLRFTEVPWQPRSAPRVSEIPDGALWTLSLEPTGEAIGNLMYRTDRFDERTVVALAEQYREQLRDLLAEAGAAVPAS